jgi:hypothetical protein
MSCFMEGCENSLGPEALEVHHKGELVGFVCEVCQGTAKGLKLFLKRDDDKTYRLTDVIPIAKPL